MYKIFSASILMLASAVVHAAPIYSYSTTDLGQAIQDASPAGGVNTAGGDVQSLETTYNASTGEFTWDYVAAPGAGNQDNDGFWLVISDGPGPKYQTGEYAILYGDTESQQVTAYEYNGANSSGSYTTASALLDIFPNSITSLTDATTGLTSVSVSINVTDINNAGVGPDWDGVQIGEQAGIWFHPTVSSNFTYLTDGGISRYTGRGGWYDTIGSVTTTSVPEPGMLALMVIGAVGLLRRKKLDVVK